MDMQVTTKNFLELIDEIGPSFAERSKENSETDNFIHENTKYLKRLKFYSAMVPVELGGGGVSHSEMCAIIQKLGRYCPSTALTFSMHQHIIAANRWNHNKGNAGKAMLEMIAAAGDQYEPAAKHQTRHQDSAPAIFTPRRRPQGRL